jgi:UDP-2-acetamido-2,6-beta-L-arabino-hexul-4-ose reductase
MTCVLVIGADTFLGRNLAVHLRQRSDCETVLLDAEVSEEDLRAALKVADVVFHLAGVYRSRDPREFQLRNVGLTEQITNLLRQSERAPKIVFESSSQAVLNNPYGASKLGAEAVLHAFAEATGGAVRIFRLKGLFGKWCSPDLNSVTATFCHNIANDLPISISDPSREIELNYVDDVMAAFLAEIDSPQGNNSSTSVPAYALSLGDLAGRIQAFHEIRHTLTLPDFADPFNRALYATYLSYVPAEALRQSLKTSVDSRGSLAEFIKSEHGGQVFISRTQPGVTRGNHFHHTKTEKFFVVEGKGLIRMRASEEKAVREYRVNGREYQVIDIPPGFTHSISNIGPVEMVTLFWASEVFDPNRPDTYYLPVCEEDRVPCTAS